MISVESPLEARDLSPLTFDPETHTYRLNGKVSPGVTEILRGAGLIPESPYSDPRAMDRGKAVHEACYYLGGDDLDEASISAEIAPYVRAYRLFLAQSGCVPEMMESPVWWRVHLYAGTLDLVGQLAGQTVLCDFKSGPPEDWHAAQLGGYAIALAESAGITVASRFCLHLGADGRYSIREYRAPESHRQFLAALAKWRGIK